MITCSIISSSYPKKFQDLWIQKYKIDVIKVCKEIANFRRNLILIVKLGNAYFGNEYECEAILLILFTLKSQEVVIYFSLVLKNI